MEGFMITRVTRPGLIKKPNFDIFGVSIGLDNSTLKETNYKNK